MVENKKNHVSRGQELQGRPLTRSVSEIASSSRNEPAKVLRAARFLNISATNQDSRVSVQDAAKVFAHLLPSPEAPRAKSLRTDTRQIRDVAPASPFVPETTTKSEEWVPLVNPVHNILENTQTGRYRYGSAKKQRPPVVKAQPEPAPIGALIPPKPPRNRYKPLKQTPGVVPKTIAVTVPAPQTKVERTPQDKFSPIGFSIPKAEPSDTFDLDFTSGAESLLNLLEGISPREFGKLFRYLNEAIGFDAQVRRMILEQDPNTPEEQLSNTVELGFLEDICRYRYGIFGYKASVRIIDRDARMSTSKDLAELTAAVCRLRPMIRGLMIDDVNKRFLGWNVGPEAKYIQTVAFNDLEQWLRGLCTGRYVRLNTVLINVGHPQTDADWQSLHFMAFAAENLRTSIQFYKEKRSTARISANENRLSAISKDAHFGTKVSMRPHSQLLIPITIDWTGEHYFGLPEGFFDEPVASPEKHQVRGFMRRPPGSEDDAAKTVFVSPHTRGGTIFDKARESLPAVSIISRK